MTYVVFVLVKAVFVLVTPAENKIFKPSEADFYNNLHIGQKRKKPFF